MSCYLHNYRSIQFAATMSYMEKSQGLACFTESFYFTTDLIV